MNRTVQSSGGTSVIWVTCLIAAALLGGAWYYHASRRPAESPPPEAVAAQSVAGSAASPAAANAVEDSELHPLTPEEMANAPRPPAVIQSASRVTTAAAPAPPRAPPTPYTQQLVANLAQLDLSHGPISPEQAAQWKQGLKTLTDQGAAAVPAIREFLERNLEFDYTAVKGGQLLEHSSMRGALLEALQQIGGPEATEVMLQTLRTTTLPAEIARLADYLEQQAPGQYRQETLGAISDVLAMASGGQWPGWDVAPLFPVLAKYGDPATLQQFQSQWRYYATMALAGLEGGQGIPALIRQVQETAGSKNDFALQILAQKAGAYPEATAALIEQARANQISENAWRKIVVSLAGDQFFMGTRPEDAGIVPGLRTYHIQSGNQNFYSLPVTGTGADPQLSQRLAVIDQLLAATSNAFARQALQQTRESLARFQ
jgi:hypothetical protein